MGDPIQAHSESSRQLKQNVGCRNIAPAKEYFICIQSYLLWSASSWDLHFHLVEYVYFCCKLAFYSPIKSLVLVDYSYSVSCILQQIQYCNKYKFIFGLLLHAEVPYLSSGSKIELRYFSQVTSWITAADKQTCKSAKYLTDCCSAFCQKNTSVSEFKKQFWYGLWKKIPPSLQPHPLGEICCDRKGSHHTLFHAVWVQVALWNS